MERLASVQEEGSVTATLANELVVMAVSMAHDYFRFAAEDYWSSRCINKLNTDDADYIEV
jgi:hypothetical protein